MRSVILTFSISTLSSAVNAGEIKVRASVYSPLFRDPGEVDSAIGPLLVDKTPVTNKEFLEFIKIAPEFSKSKIQPLFADTGYLAQWSGDREFTNSHAQFPVTNVSWFVARKYCKAQGKRLPTIAEWEVFSDAQNPLNEAIILGWYGKPNAPLRNVGTGTPNKFGLMDTHGLIWEWVDNFSETVMSGDSRGGSPTESLFCGGAALKTKDPRVYATFMRFAFRSSLNAKYTSTNLGFRCVKDIKDDSK